LKYAGNFIFLRLANREPIFCAEQLKERLNLNTDNIVELSEEEVKAEVDTAVGQLIHPLKMKCHLVGQLKTQITDLEMFIEFLQSESAVAATAAMNTDCG
jgi:chaperonin cofactor prefoldin